MTDTPPTDATIPVICGEKRPDGTHRLYVPQEMLEEALARAEKLQADADALSHNLRAYQRTTEDLARLANKFEAERDEALAKVARYETLRPLSEWKEGDYDVLWWYRRNDGGMYGLQSRFDHCLGWTPLPDVKEAKP